MEDMGAIFMNMNALYKLTIDIASYMWALIYHQASLSVPMSLTGKGGPKQTRADYQIIITFHQFCKHIDLNP